MDLRGCEQGSSGSEQGTMAISCKQGNAPLGYIEGKEFFDKLSVCQSLKDSALQSQLGIISIGNMALHPVEYELTYHMAVVALGVQLLQPLGGDQTEHVLPAHFPCGSGHTECSPISARCYLQQYYTIIHQEQQQSVMLKYFDSTASILSYTLKKFQQITIHQTDRYCIACFHSVQNCLSFCLISRNLKINTQNYNCTASIVLYRCETQYHSLRKEYIL